MLDMNHQLRNPFILVFYGSSVKQQAAKGLEK